MTVAAAANIAQRAACRRQQAAKATLRACDVGRAANSNAAGSRRGAPYRPNGSNIRPATDKVRKTAPLRPNNRAVARWPLWLYTSTPTTDASIRTQVNTLSTGPPQKGESQRFRKVGSASDGVSACGGTRIHQ